MCKPIEINFFSHNIHGVVLSFPPYLDAAFPEPGGPGHLRAQIHQVFGREGLYRLCPFASQQERGGIFLIVLYDLKKEPDCVIHTDHFGYRIIPI